jgi:membrane protein YqaA with SNARE-associated domain
VEVAALLGWSFMGAVFWVFNTEATAVYYSSARGWAPPLVGLLCAAGQTAMYVVLFAGGERLARWRWFHAKIQRVRERWDATLARWFLPTALLAGLVGFPPAVAFPSLAPGFAVPLVRVLPVLFVGRLVRFTALAAAGRWAAS